MWWSVAIACFTARQGQAAEGEFLESASRYEPPKKRFLRTDGQALRGVFFRLQLFHGIRRASPISMSQRRKFRLLADRIRMMCEPRGQGNSLSAKSVRPASQEPEDAPLFPTKKAKEAPSPTSAKKVPKKQQATVQRPELTRKLSRQSEDAAAFAKMKT